MKYFFTLILLGFTISVSAQSQEEPNNLPLTTPGEMVLQYLTVEDDLKLAPPTDGQPNQFHIDFVGTANLQANLSEASDEVQGAAGLGVIFERYFIRTDDVFKDYKIVQNEDLKLLIEQRDLERDLKRLGKRIKKIEEKEEKEQSDMEELSTYNAEKQELQNELSSLKNTTENIIIEREYKKFIESLDMESYINVASSVDSLIAIVEEGDVVNQRLFGNYLLNPVSSKQSVFINANVFFNPEPLWVKGRWFPKIISGANFRINASNVQWSLGENNSTFAGALNLRFGLFHEFLPNDKIRDDQNRRKYSVRIGLNYTFRELAGDISSQDNNDDLIRFLGTNNTSYSGWEPSFGFRLNNIIAEFSMPMIGGSDETDVAGLTDTQFLFSIRFVGGFSIKLEDKPKSEDSNKQD